MRHTVTFTIPGEPVPWKRAGARGKRRYTQPLVAAHAETIRQAWQAAGRPDFGDEGVVVSAMFFYRKRAADLDNYLKLVLDALNGHAWRDDSQVVCFSGIHKLPAGEGREPRTELTIWTATHDRSEPLEAAA